MLDCTLQLSDSSLVHNRNQYHLFSGSGIAVLTVTLGATPEVEIATWALALDRRGYANLSLWITLARRRAAKGAYLAHPGDLEGRAPTAPMLAGLPGCLALLVPMPGQAPETVLEHARWLQQWVGDDDRGRLRADSPTAIASAMANARPAHNIQGAVS